ncbi:MAG: rhodanese-like domain-containing protein [Acidobacteriota bacterium]|nr:rhodanese-like domain-containing protein [Acidobacteriota bacterium]
MNVRRHLLEAATLVSAAVLCALVANALASRERKLALVGSYPNAVTVPASPTTDADPKPIPVATAPTQLPIEEKRPGPTPPAAPKAGASPVGSEAKSPSSPADLTRRFPPHNKPYVEISGDDAAWLFARGMLVLDARRTKDFEAGHIAGSRSFPVWESDIDARVTALVGEGRDGAIPVVLYCSGGDCEDSHMLAQKLYGGGFNNLLVYRDGWPDWQKRGGRSATGPES